MVSNLQIEAKLAFTEFKAHLFAREASNYFIIVQVIIKWAVQTSFLVKWQQEWRVSQLFRFPAVYGLATSASRLGELITEQRVATNCLSQAMNAIILRSSCLEGLVGAPVSPDGYCLRGPYPGFSTVPSKTSTASNGSSACHIAPISTSTSISRAQGSYLQAVGHYCVSCQV